jgi:hypothetical protein
MNDEARRQTVSASKLRFARFTTPKRSAFRKQFGASRAMNRSIHSASAKESSVCSVHDCGHIQFGDVATDDLDSAIRILQKSPRY